MLPTSTAVPSGADRVTTLTRVVAVAATIALIVLGTGWELVWARIGHGSLVIKVVPLLIALPGLLKHRMYTYRWLSLVIWIYVAEGAIRLADPAPLPWLAGLEIALSILLFTACATQVRWRLAVARRLSAVTAQDDNSDAGTAH